MKVVMLFPGIVGYRLSLSRALAASGDVELVLLTNTEHEIAGDDSAYRTLITFRILGSRLNGRVVRSLGIRKLANLYLGVVSALRSALFCARERPDLVHVQGLLYAEPLCIVCLLALKALGFRVVFTPHDAGPRSRRPGMDLMWWILLTLSDRVVAHSGVAAARLAEAYSVGPHKIDVIPFANYDVAAIPRKGLDRTGARQILELPEHAPVLLFFGLVRPYKGLEFLIQALAHLVKDLHDIRLLIVGEAIDGFGQYDHLIRSLALQDRTVTRIESWIAASEHAKYFMAADLVILPYRNLAEIDTSAVAAEALSFGRAVIASDVGGLREQVIDGITGIKVPPEDVAALVAAIRDLLRDEGRRRDMEAAALKRAAELSWDRFAYETVTVYRKTLQRS